jgi:hypothetical protein
MPEPRVQRTLVKSPPELWAEISDVSTLARHLGELGDIRITRLENETTVVWEGDRACGTVELEASGWGTKVTITAAAVEAPEPEPEPAAVAEAEAEALAEPEPVAEVAAVAVAQRTPEAAVEPPAEQPTATLAVPQPEPKRGLFARLFRRRAAVAPTLDRAPVAEPEAVVEPEAVSEPEAVVEPVAVVEPEPEPAPDPALPAFDDERLEAVLVGVLDDLGSAHHRPFSRG